jgi:hypothetical protein
MLATVIASAVIATACGPIPPDEQVVRRFFEESRTYDKTRLAAIAQVVFDPRVEGVVERFSVVERSDRPLPENQLRRRLTIQADVRSAAGRMDQRTLVVTLEGRDRKWIVTAFQ